MLQPANRRSGLGACRLAGLLLLLLVGLPGGLCGYLCSAGLVHSPLQSHAGHRPDHGPHSQHCHEGHLSAPATDSGLAPYLGTSGVELDVAVRLTSVPCPARSLTPSPWDPIPDSPPPRA